MATVSFPKKFTTNPANPSLDEEKKQFRRTLLLLREKISEARRMDAARSLLSSLKDTPLPLILSFASFGSEIDTRPLNRYLAQKGQLILPKIEEETLVTYRVSDIDLHLAPNHLGILEPIKALCPKISLEQISLILVPGLGFDPHCHRIGYGRGFYDRLLASLPSCPSYGVGFSEQLVPQLPISEQDFPVTELLLF